MEADAKPLPRDETTPPVTKINFFSIHTPEMRRPGGQTPCLLACRTRTLNRWFCPPWSPRHACAVQISQDRQVCRSPTIHSQLRRREYDSRARARATVRAFPLFPTECARALRIFSKNPRGKRTDRGGENRSLWMEFSSGKNKARFHPC